MPALRIVATGVPGADVVGFVDSVVGDVSVHIVPGFRVYQFVHEVSRDASAVVCGPVRMELWVLDGSRYLQSAAAAAFSSADAVLLAIGGDVRPDLAPLTFFHGALGSTPPTVVACVALGTGERPYLPVWFTSMLWRPTLVVPHRPKAPDARVTEFMTDFLDEVASLGDGAGLTSDDELHAATALATLSGRTTDNNRGYAIAPAECCGCCCEHGGCAVQ